MFRNYSIDVWDFGRVYPNPGDEVQQRASNECDENSRKNLLHCCRDVKYIFRRAEWVCVAEVSG